MPRRKHELEAVALRQPRQHIGEPSLRIDIVKLGGGDQRLDGGWRLPPSSEPTKVQLRRPAAICDWIERRRHLPSPSGQSSLLPNRPAGPADRSQR